MPRRSFLVAGIFALALAGPALIAQDGPPPGRQGHFPPMPKPTNLKVLPKDIPPKELMAIMHGFAGALGVKCTFCHEMKPGAKHPDFASDAKPDKEIARTMMRMTRTINQDYMSQVHDPDAKPEDKHVTCGTCHRGHQMPVVFVPPPEHHGPPGAPGSMPMPPAGAPTPQ